MTGFDAWIGRSDRATDTLRPEALERLGATLGRRFDTPPPLVHWLLFQEWQPPGSLGPDGHPARGGFLPPVLHLPRRMWAGGRIAFHAPLPVGVPLNRTRTIRAVEAKRGGTGELLFVTVEHAVASPEGLVLTELQDIVYRSAEGAGLRPADPAPPWPDALRREVRPDPVLLFRYSALTGNGHRIHYDHPYATGTEGYPGLVVHGPLQATWLALLAEEAAGRPVRAFAFRGRRAAICGAPLSLLARPEGSRIQLETRDDAGCTCLSAEAETG
ncbi:MAG: MaoC family dehydratase N-terminal domain-containing protein [Acetobacteraceae bacterium]|nr:MaoC family dehydratase N-terminal domain-containing protein [Acetobacteraceae bacterium]MDW8397150.1 MaoC family dehydratase N-terminal domain-containing protein [Acetobacteraceae bacterium]